MLKKKAIEFEEFDKSLSKGQLIKSLQEAGHRTELIAEIEDGLDNSSIYMKNLRDLS